MKRFPLDQMPAAILFDMDGVLCDTQPMHLLAFQELARRHDINLSAEQFKTMFGMENRKLIPKLFGRPLPEDEIREHADWKEARYRQLIDGQIELMRGVADLVDWLRSRGIGRAVASSAPKANVEQILRSSGLIDHFGTYLASEDVTHHKPHPEIYLTAAELLGVEPARAWVIEDSLHGIEAGQRAGMRVLAVATTHPAEELQVADAVFDNVAQILDMLKN
ncbi:HAD family phosphatase [bacterium]|jgi:beta-phosphoglucomutase|nr:HAD family phosphatase [bacterium]